tara:strand:- start:537 stop:1178 length:642 start_codon:yes stop_codon:yes gene_type:complete
MSKMIVSFGDSWPAGAELNTGEKPFGELIAEQSDYNHANYSQSGTSIPHMILQLQKYIKNDPGGHPYALFCITSSSRSLYYDDDYLLNLGWREIHIHNEDAAGESYYRHLYSDTLAYFHANVYILALQQICIKHKIKDRYVFCWESFDLMPGIDTSKIYPHTLVDIIGAGAKPAGKKEVAIDRNHECVKPNDCHPNQKGHQKIADELAEWIQK